MFKRRLALFPIAKGRGEQAMAPDSIVVYIPAEGRRGLILGSRNLFDKVKMPIVSSEKLGIVSGSG